MYISQAAFRSGSFGSHSISKNPALMLREVIPHFSSQSLHFILAEARRGGFRVQSAFARNFRRLKRRTYLACKASPSMSVNRAEVDIQPVVFCTRALNRRSGQQRFAARSGSP